MTAPDYSAFPFAELTADEITRLMIESARLDDTDFVAACREQLKRRQAPPVTAPDPIAAWVARIRLAGDEMDAWAASLHPSAWDEALADRRAAFAKLCANGPARPANPKGDTDR